MADNRSWLWKKKSTEKIIVAPEKLDLPLKEKEEEHLTGKTELERDLKLSNERLSLALFENNNKDDLAKQHAKIAQEALAGWEKSEAEALSFKRQLDEALKQRVAGDESSTHLEAALKDCKHQLRFVREEQEQRIHDVLTKTSRNFEKERLMLEERLAETNRRLVKLGAENTQLSKALLAKERSINDLNERRTLAEADFHALMTRLESTEKENASLKYEVRVLQKELEIRNEEREFNRRTADVSHKQHLENVKKIAKLESECQRLRILVRKRLPGPAALAKMKNEVELLGRDPAETRRQKSNASPTSSMDFGVDNDLHTPSKRINFLTEQLSVIEEENRNLKETLHKKTNELQFSRAMHSRTASKLTQVEAQFEESPKGDPTAERTRNVRTSHRLSLASMSDIGSDDKGSCAESWASALISELEHFKNGNQSGAATCKTVASEMTLMDDFVEMEKLAIVSGDKSYASSCLASDEGRGIVGPLETNSRRYSLAATGEDSISIADCKTSFDVLNQEIESRNILTGKVPDWLNNVLHVILEQNRLTHRNPDEILKDIEVALAYINNRNSIDFVDARDSSNYSDALTSTHGSGYISWMPPENSPIVQHSSKEIDNDFKPLGKKSNQLVPSNLSKSICKVIKLIEGVGLPSRHYTTPDTLPYKNLETPAGYMVRVFQWKTSELGYILQEFVRTCNDLLNGKANLEEFAQELTSALDWIMNHCFSLQDVSSMRDAIIKDFNWDESRSESEMEGGVFSQFSEADKLHIHKEQLLLQMEELQVNAKEDCRRLKTELADMEAAKRDLEGKLKSETDKNDSLMIQLRELEGTIQSLKVELETLKHAKRMIEEQVSNLNLANEDLDKQLTYTRVEFSDALEKLACLETELESKNNCYEEMEATCVDLQLQLESVKKKEIPAENMDQEDKQLRTDWEITAASEKLAECQETILNLGKQLKALASPNHAAILEKVIPSPANTTAMFASPKMNSQRSSLLDKMLAEDNAKVVDLKSPISKEVNCNSESLKLQTPEGYSGSAFRPNGVTNRAERFPNLNGVDHHYEAPVNSLSMVPSKKKGGGGLWKKLFWTKKKGNSRKLHLPLAA